MENQDIKKLIEDQITYLRRQTVYTIHRWRRDYVANLLALYIKDIKFKEDLTTRVKEGESRDAIIEEVLKQLESEKDEAKEAKQNVELELEKAKEENAELLHKNAQLKVFGSASIIFIKQNKIGFIGFLVMNGLLDKLGFTAQDCVGENSKIMQWIDSLNVEAIEEANLLGFTEYFEKALTL